MPLDITFPRSNADGQGDSDADYYSVRYSTANNPPLASDEVAQVAATGAASYTHSHAAHTNGATAFFSVACRDTTGNVSNALSGSINVSSGVAVVQSASAYPAATGATLTTQTTTLDAVATAGTLLVATYTTDKDPGAISGSAGWTKLFESRSASVSQAVFYKIAAGGETGFTASWPTATYGGGLAVTELSGAAAPSATFATALSEPNTPTSVSLNNGATAGPGLSLAFVGVDTVYLEGSLAGPPWSVNGGYSLLEAAPAEGVALSGGAHSGSSHYLYRKTHAASGEATAVTFTAPAGETGDQTAAAVVFVPAA